MLVANGMHDDFDFDELPEPVAPKSGPAQPGPAPLAFELDTDLPAPPDARPAAEVEEMPQRIVNRGTVRPPEPGGAAPPTAESATGSWAAAVSSPLPAGAGTAGEGRRPVRRMPLTDLLPDRSERARRRLQACYGCCPEQLAPFHGLNPRRKGGSRVEFTSMGVPLFVDEGEVIRARRSVLNREAAETLVELARMKGFAKVELHGTEAFKHAAWQRLQDYGIEVTNYTPPPRREKENAIVGVEVAPEMMDTAGAPTP